MEVTDVEGDRRPWWLRLRSAFILVLSLVGLGVVAAAAIGLAGLTVVGFFDRALG